MTFHGTRESASDVVLDQRPFAILAEMMFDQQLR